MASLAVEAGEWSGWNGKVDYADMTPGTTERGPLVIHQLVEQRRTLDKNTRLSVLEKANVMQYRHIIVDLSVGESANSVKGSQGLRSGSLQVNRAIQTGRYYPNSHSLTE